MITVTLYQKDNCPECEQVLQELEGLKDEIPHQLVLINIKDDIKFFEKYQNSVPVIEVGPYVNQRRFPVGKNFVRHWVLQMTGTNN